MNRSAGERQPSVAAGIAHRHARDLQPDAGAPGDVVAVLGEQPDDGGAHRAAAEQPDANRSFLVHAPLAPAHPSPPIQAAMSISSS